MKTLLVALLSLCLFSSALAEDRLTPTTSPAPAAPPTPAAKKAAPKAKATAKPAPPANAGPCGYGVIAATGDIFTVQKIGLTVFGNEYPEVPVPWGFDDLIFARVRAAAGPTSVRRIAYAKGAFDSYEHPKANLFRNARQELTELVRQIAGNAGCERYMVITRLDAPLPGTNQKLNGIGIVNVGTSLLNRSQLFANVSIIVFDGQTFEIRKDPHDSIGARLERMGKDESMRNIDNSAFPTSPPDAVNNAGLRAGAQVFLTERLDKLLPAYFKE
jgi:hypothetical protein